MTYTTRPTGRTCSECGRSISYHEFELKNASGELEVSDLDGPSCWTEWCSAHQARD
jgi:hypothetical protein|nr:hypothetical protein [uncultured Rhodococcus sp.]